MVANAIIVIVIIISILETPFSVGESDIPH
jgi:hypothetical protein